MLELWVIAAVLALCAVNILLLLAVRRQRQLVLRQQAALDAVRHDIRALFAAGVGVGRRMLETERRLRTLSNRQDQLDLQETATGGSYEQAIRMVQKGADPEQLRDLGLTRGEAELVSVLHRLDEASKASESAQKNLASLGALSKRDRRTDQSDDPAPSPVSM